jgi:hypothetical protein
LKIRNTNEEESIKEILKSANLGFNYDGLPVLVN